MLGRQPLRRQVLGAAVIMLALLAAVHLWSARQTRAERTEDVRGEAARAATSVGVALDQYVAALTRLAGVLAGLEPIVRLDRDEATPLLADVLRGTPAIANVMLIDAGRRFVAWGRPGTSSTVAEPTVSYVNEVLEQGRAVLTNLHRVPGTDLPALSLGVPVRDAAGRTVGVLAFRLDLARMQDVARRFPLEPGSVVTVLDRQRHVVTRSERGDEFVGRVMPASAPDAAAPLVDMDGTERLVGTSQAVDGQLHVLVGIPVATAQARAAGALRRNLLAVTLGWLAALAFALMLAMRVSRHVERLRATAGRIAAGDLDAARSGSPTMGSLELGQLEAAFATMGANLRDAREQHEQQVREAHHLNERLQSLQRHVVRHERVAAVGQLVSGVSHELNNPLQAVLGTVEMLERHRGLDSSALEELAFIKTQALRARDTIRSLSRFSGPHSGTLEPVDVLQVVEEALHLRHPQLGALGVQTRLTGSTMRLVSASFSEVARVVLHLIVNAEQAVIGVAEPCIEIRLSDAGPYVRLEVHDNGPGVAPEDEPRLFQPFFTRREVGEGAGLALSASHGIIRSYGGTIGYFRNEWGGAAFYFELPAIGAHDHAQDGPSLLRPSQPSGV